MPDFVLNATTLATGKADLVAAPNTTNYVAASEWNAALQASLDVRAKLFNYNLKTIAVGQTLDTSSATWNVSATGQTITLPTGVTGTIYLIKDTSGNANPATVIGPTNGLIDGAASKTISSAYGWFAVRFNGTNWDVIGTNAGGGGSGTVTSVVIGNGLASTQSPLTTTGTMSIDTSVTVDKTTAQTLTNKTLTAPIINGAASASGNFDLSGSGGTTKTTTGACTFGGSSNTFTNNISVPEVDGIGNTKITFGANITISTNSGFVLPHSDGGDNFGSVSGTRWAYVASWVYDTKQGAQLTAASTITPTVGQHHVTGGTTITTIAATNMPGNAELTLIADGGTITLSTGGNIGAAVTIAQSKAQKFVYDSAGTTWYPVQ